MDKLKDLKDSIANKITGKDKYHSNLLGESLADLLRKATAKTLVTPDEGVNQQVVDTIQQEVAGGKDTKEIVSLLKKRLRTDNPQKQWLAVQLLGKVMTDCGNILGMHQEELLQEVARVMARPARPETDAGKQARHAAKELLRRFGRAGTTAFRAAQQEVYGRPMAAGGTTATGYPAGGIPYGYSPADYGTPGYAGAAGGAGGALSVEKQSLSEEIRLLIDKARSNTELLSDMLVNTNPGGQDEFENELISDLLNEVSELRGLFNAYLEQLQVHDGPEMEVLMVEALEAVDMLDGCLALQKDVNSNQVPGAAPPPPPPGGGPMGYTGSTLTYQLAPTGAASSSAAPAAPAAAPAPAANTGGDLIALDDLADALPAAPAAAAATTAVTSSAGGAPFHDPFAASDALFAAPSPAPAAPAPGAGAPPAMKSAFEAMFAQPGVSAGLGATLAASAAPTAAAGAQPGAQAQSLPAQPYQQQQPVPQQQPQQPTYAATPGFGTTGNPYGQPYGAPPQPVYNPYNAPAQYGAPQQQYGVPQQYAIPQQQYGAPQQYAIPQQQYGAPQPGVYGSPSPYPAAVNPYGPPQPTGAAQPATSNNPFAGLPVTTSAPDGSGFGMPMPPPGLMGPSKPVPATNNPFAAPVAAQPVAISGGGGAGLQTSVDQEWDMFFADRAGGAAAAPGGAGVGRTNQVNADFDALVGKPTAAR